MPLRFYEPMKCLLVSELPDDSDEWMYEMKLDGYRAIAIKHGKQIELRSRNHSLLNGRYPHIVSALQELSPRNVVLDGEIVMLDDKGYPSFQLLQHGKKSDLEKIYFYVFDLLFEDGKEWSRSPLRDRRERLQKILPATESFLRYNIELDGTPSELIPAFHKFRLEGIVAKRRRSIYEAGKRSGAWVKFKIENQQEFVIGGFRPSGKPNAFDLLLIGYYSGKKLKYAAKLKAGFTERDKKEIFRQMHPLITLKCPFTDIPVTGGGRWGQGFDPEEFERCLWVKPKLICQVRFTEWTARGHLRHPYYIGLRTDKAATDVVRENP